MHRRGNVLNPVDTIHTPPGSLLIATDSSVEDGELCYVRDQELVGPVFIYRRSTGIVPDNINSFAALYGDGVWVRTNLAIVGAPDGSIEGHRVAFDTASASPIVLGVLATGSLLERAVVVIQAAFDDPLSRVRFGTSADVNAFLNVPATVGGQFDSHVLTEAVLPDVLMLTVDKQASTQGRGLLFYEVMP